MNLKWELVSDDINQANQKSIHFARLKIPHVLRVSMVSFLSATKPLGTHIHKDCMEICYLYSGHQVYQVDGENYGLKIFSRENEGTTVILNFPCIDL